MADKFNKGDQVLGPMYSRDVPIYAIIEAFHSPDGGSIYKVRPGDMENSDDRDDQLLPEEVLTKYDTREGQYFEFNSQIFLVHEGKPTSVDLSRIMPLIVRLLNKHVAEQGG